MMGTGKVKMEFYVDPKMGAITKEKPDKELGFNHFTIYQAPHLSNCSEAKM